jgi:hypothetical protein
MLLKGFSKIVVTQFGGLAKNGRCGLSTGNAAGAGKTTDRPDQLVLLSYKVLI